MRAVRMLAAKDLRGRWRSSLALVLLVGIVGAVVLATAAGARRSSTALTRFNAFSEPSQLSYLTPFAYAPTPAQIAAVERIPTVEAMTEVRFYAVRAANLLPTTNVASDVADFGTVDRARLVRGRFASPAASDEVNLDVNFARANHVGVGSTIQLGTYTQAQVNAATNGPPPVALGPNIALRVVGLIRRPVDIGTVTSQGLVELPPGFDRAYFSRVGNFGGQIDFRTAHGLADRPSVTAAMQAIFHPMSISAQSSVQSDAARAQSAIDALTLALWIIAGITALAGAVTIGIVLQRDILRSSDEQPTLRTLGLTRGERIAALAPRVIGIAFTGALFAVGVAIAASPRFPIGIARQADPNVGVHADWVVLALGFGALMVTILALGAVAAVRVTRGAPATNEGGSRPSVVVERAVHASVSPTLTSGLRLAFEPGRGRSAIPVRSAVLGAIVGTLGITAAIVFATSLQQLIATPTRYGWTWTVAAADVSYQGNVKQCTSDDDGLSRVPGVTAVAVLCVDETQVGGRPVYGWAFTAVRGSIPPGLIAGRTPTTPDEVALGPQTMRALRTHIGAQVPIHGTGASALYTIVGEAVFADAHDGTPMSDGALFTQSGLVKAFDANNSSDRYVVADVAHGSNTATVTAAVAKLPNLATPSTRILPVEVGRLNSIRRLPAILAALLATLAIIAIAHALVTSTRRRRRDLAVLKTLGFTRRQVEATIAWQATALAVTGLVVGVPLGALVGRALWTRVEHNLGVVSPPALGLVSIALIALATIVVANAIAWLPARAAARTSPAAALRSE